MEFYLSSSNDAFVTFRAKVDRVLMQVRGEQLGALIKSDGFDEDGDARLLVEPQAVARLMHIADKVGLELYRLGSKSNR